MGFDPDEKDASAFAEKGKVLELPKAIRWLTDPGEAEKIGMAVKIPLTQAELLSGVSRLVVLGVKTSADPADGSRLLTRLFDNHHFKPDGLAILPQGTSTNNIPGQPSGYNPAGLSDAASFNLEFPERNDTDPLSDGRKLSDALGLHPNAFLNIFNNQAHEGEQALLLNRALWPGTLGYYLDNHMRPTVTDADISFVKNFFQQYVTGRGLLPAFRVGKQPGKPMARQVWKKKGW